MKSRFEKLKRGIVIAAPFVRIAREPDDEGWLTITAKGHAWLHGDRESAIADKTWLDAQWRRAEGNTPW
jgi:hypothetical protein